MNNHQRISICVTITLGIVISGCKESAVPTPASTPQTSVAPDNDVGTGSPQFEASPRPLTRNTIGIGEGTQATGDTLAETKQPSDGVSGSTWSREAVPVKIASSGSAPSNRSDTAAPQVFSPDDIGYRRLIVPFLNRHCLKCHGPDVHEAAFRVDEHLPNEFLTRSVAAKWGEVLNMLNTGEMPPQEEPDPTSDSITRVVEWITRERLRSEEARKVTSIVLRRMNRAEYNNTIRDLLGIDMSPADGFPADPPAAGFDNLGSALTISPLHLEMYLKAARDVLDRAITTDRARPPTIRWRFQLEEGNQGLDRYRVNIDGQRIIVNGGNSQFRDGLTVLRREKQWDGFAQVRDFKVPQAGYYAIRIRAAGVVPDEAGARRAGPGFHERRQKAQEQKLASEQERRESRERFEKWVRPYVAAHFAEDRSYRYGPPRAKLVAASGGAQWSLGEFDVDAPSSELKTYEVRTWLEPVTAGIQLRNVYHIPEHNYNFWFQENDDFPRPELLIDWLEIEGPLYDDWPPMSHQRIFIDSPDRERDEEGYARNVLANFMRHAYRRPLREGEVESKLAMFRRVRAQHESLEEALKIPLTAILCSPHFLYLVEPASTANEAARQLDNHQLATRLSYFLWSSMPDDELFALAEEGRLANPTVLVAQVDRMLADPRSQQFVKNFAGQWLGLRDLGANPPSGAIFTRYDDHLEASMRGESEAFFAELLRNDRSVTSFLRSDFMTINERLARYYDIPGVKGDEFRVVKVPADAKRGGLVTQASILSLTSNGTRTSPVRRGVWILERLLGAPPPPPPPNAGDIPPGMPGQSKTTVRERLRLHREQPQCARCHNKIDPLGFALENFNAAGEWRDREAQGSSSQPGPNDPTINAQAQLPDGTEFVGVEGLQRELLKREDDFLRCLAEKMYVYALGRELGLVDQPLLAAAVRDMKQNQTTLRSLIHHVVSSDQFRTR